MSEAESHSSTNIGNEMTVKEWLPILLNIIFSDDTNCETLCSSPCILRQSLTVLVT